MRTIRILNGNVPIPCMSQNRVIDNMLVPNRVYLIITKVLHGLHMLNREHAYVEYTLLAGTIVEYHYYTTLNIIHQTKHHRWVPSRPLSGHHVPIHHVCIENSQFI